MFYAAVGKKSLRKDTFSELFFNNPNLQKKLINQPIFPNNNYKVFK